MFDVIDPGAAGVLTGISGVVELFANGSSTPFALAANESVYLVANSIALTVSFVLFQVFSPNGKNVTIGGQWTFPSQNMSGPSVGFVVGMVEGGRRAVCGLSNPSRVDPVEVWGHIVEYGSGDPIPGGCNQEFAMEITPMMVPQWVDGRFPAMTQVLEVPVAGQGWDRSGGGPVGHCYNQDGSEYQYTLYGGFLDRPMNKHWRSGTELAEQFLQMGRLGSLGTTAHKLCSKTGEYSLNFTLPSWPGRPVVYSLLVERSVNGSRMGSAVYTPAVLDGCEGGHVSADGLCHVPKASSQEIATAVILGLLALLFLFTSQRLYGYQQFVLGCCVGAILAHVFIARYAAAIANVWTIDLLTLFIGLAAGFAWYSLWWFVGTDSANFTLALFLAGFCVASVISYFAYDTWPLLEFQLEYFTAAFVATMVVVELVVLLLVSVKPRKLEKPITIVCCALLGGYIVTMALSSLAGATVHYIFLWALYRFSLPEWDHACFLVAPLDFVDIILLVMWGLLTILGVTAQYFLTRGQPRVPPCQYRYFPRSGLWGLVVGRLKQPERLPQRYARASGATGSLRPVRDGLAISVPHPAVPNYYGSVAPVRPDQPDRSSAPNIANGAVPTANAPPPASSSLGAIPERPKYKKFKLNGGNTVMISNRPLGTAFDEPKPVSDSIVHGLVTRVGRDAGYANLAVGVREASPKEPSLADKASLIENECNLAMDGPHSKPKVPIVEDLGTGKMGGGGGVDNLNGRESTGDRFKLAKDAVVAKGGRGANCESGEIISSFVNGVADNIFDISSNQGILDKGNPNDLSGGRDQNRPNCAAKATQASIEVRPVPKGSDTPGSSSSLTTCDSGEMEGNDFDDDDCDCKTANVDHAADGDLSVDDVDVGRSTRGAHYFDTYRPPSVRKDSEIVEIDDGFASAEKTGIWHSSSSGSSDSEGGEQG